MSNTLDNLTEAEWSVLLKVLEQMGYESEELHHDLVELLLESNGTAWGAVHLAELEQGFRQLGEQPPKGIRHLRRRLRQDYCADMGMIWKRIMRWQNVMAY